ncbi:hypothetical protein U5801_00955 [Lamprobacter modestohalophilus]|uniref:hypothetical protein n=1 Tax=Lamprobacter modestohalophilus TaxID=1064514 RepID=UPI002ADEE7F8|nr:hypothetical protein [Lamprobacter modestohalophilus]MEA1048392.1 hypothetical protein [Lamprobacter modestohalophilus]
MSELLKKIIKERYIPTQAELDALSENELLEVEEWYLKQMYETDYDEDTIDSPEHRSM